ncbi:MAG: L-histidine N(alpha)-methyltransferase [Patescibacteria group bacterium]
MKNLENKNYINKYISVGISPEMARIRQKNINENTEIPTSKYIYDVEENILRNLLFKEKENNKYTNLCTLLFSGLSNIRNVPALLGNLVESLSPNDYLLLSTVLGDDSSEDLIKNKVSQNIVNRHSWLLDLLGLTSYISSQFYNYDSTNRLRTSYFIMNRDIELEFEIDGREYTISLLRDEKITFFVSNRYTSSELFNYFANAGFVVDQYNTDREQIFALYLLRVKKY